jgi:hypothetical protein
MKAAFMAQRFNVAGRLVTVKPTGSGNVNDTYTAIFRTHFSEERFILQRINKRVFPNPEHIMDNMRIVTDHVIRRLEEEEDRADRIWQLPKVIQSKEGENYVIDGDGDYWRSISLISSAEAYEKIQSIEHAHEAGFVLGQFQRLISDIPPESLHDTLEGFHITPRYLKKYDATLGTEGAQTRLESSPEARHCRNFIAARRNLCSVLEDAKDRGELILRPTHGDPKVANIMIDNATGKGTAMVDLDTVKPGLIHYDFGDCLRSCCNPGGEEAADLSQVCFDTDICQVVTNGYLAWARDFLTDADRHYLYDSIRLIAFELGLRFFTDYLAGDPYFKTRYDGQNLQRARVQFKLTESIETREPIIRKILN